MPALSVYFGAEKDVGDSFNAYLDYVYGSTLKQMGRQSHEPVRVGVFGHGAEALMKVSSDVKVLQSVRDAFKAEMEARKLTSSDMSSFDIIFEFGYADVDAFTKAFELFLLSLAEWAYTNGLLVGFGVHLMQKHQEKGTEPPHIHVVWQRGSFKSDDLSSFLVSEFS